MQNKIIIATTTWWPLAARLAAEFAALGAKVAAICPRGSPVLAVSGVREVYKYSALAPSRSLAAALRTSRADLIVPCDDRAVAHLHALHASASKNDDLRSAIERSLGAPDGYKCAIGRGATLDLASRAGILEPASSVLRSEAEVRSWFARRTLPALLKADGTWGGAGVRRVATQDAAVAAFRHMSRPIATWRAVKFLLSNRDPFPLHAWLHRKKSAVIGQDFIKGRSTNIMIACWQGEVLATAGAEVLRTAREFGAATIIRPIRHAGMEDAATRLVRRLGMSGFCGLDFIIDDETGKAWLIELNPRATQLGHLPLCAAGTLAAVLLAKLRGETLPAPYRPPVIQDTIAFFPQAWFAGTPAFMLRSAYHDIPWEDPFLAAQLVRRPWDTSGLIARLTDVLLRRPNPEKVFETSVARMHAPEPSEEPLERLRAATAMARAEAAMDPHAVLSGSTLIASDMP